MDNNEQMKPTLSLNMQHQVANEKSFKHQPYGRTKKYTAKKANQSESMAMSSQFSAHQAVHKKVLKNSNSSLGLGGGVIRTQNRPGVETCSAPPEEEVNSMMNAKGLGGKNVQSINQGISPPIFQSSRGQSKLQK